MLLIKAFVFDFHSLSFSSSLKNLCYLNGIEFTGSILFENNSV